MQAAEEGFLAAKDVMSMTPRGWMGSSQRNRFEELGVNFLSWAGGWGRLGTNESARSGVRRTNQVLRCSNESGP